MNERTAHEWDTVRQFALGFPAAIEDFPWGIPVVKVDTGAAYPPAFVWLGKRDADEHAVVVKLTDSYDQAVVLAGAAPTTHSGVGQFGRLTVPLGVVDVELVHDWIEESYRNIAPRRLVAQLDART